MNWTKKQLGDALAASQRAHLQTIEDIYKVKTALLELADELEPEQARKLRMILGESL